MCERGVGGQLKIYPSKRGESGKFVHWNLCLAPFAQAHSLQSTNRSLIMSFSYYQKIEKLQSSLHLLGEKDDSQPTNQHIVFVDTKKEGKHQS